MIWLTTVISFLRKSGLFLFNGLKKFFKWDSEQGKWLSPLKTFIILGLLIYILYVHSCTKVNCPEIVTTTSIRHTSHIDTLLFPQIPTTTEGKKPIKHDGGISLVDTPKTKCDSLFKYTQEYEDSLIKGTLFADVRGELIGSKFTYTPKFPKYIIKTDSVFVNTTTIVKIPTYERTYGLIIGGGMNVAHNQTFGFTVDVGVQFKQGFDIIYRFDPIRTTHSLGLTYTFEFNKRKKK
jgi:hypothetical protein